MDSNQGQPQNPFQAPADEVAVEANADVLLFNNPLDEGADRYFIQVCRLRTRKRPNVLLLLITNGGSAHEAFRVARYLQRAYKRFTILVCGPCMSAGTLVVLGANEIAMGDDGRVGPLDVQLLKRDEIGEAQSGLTSTLALVTLNQQAFSAFEYFMLETKRKGQPTITLKMAMEIATRLTTGLFQPIYQQFDPMHVGEAGRAMAIARRYGEILHRYGQNFDIAVLDHLIGHYPSHDFGIDREQVEGIFEHVRSLTPTEQRLIDALDDAAITPMLESDVPFITYLSSEFPDAPPDGGQGDLQQGGVTSVQKDEHSAAAAVAGEGSKATSHTDGAKNA